MTQSAGVVGGNEITGTGETTSFAELLETVAARPTPAAYARASRALGAFAPELEPLRVALLSSYTIDTLVPYLAVESAREGFVVESHVGPFHSALQELLDPNSATARFAPDVVVIAQTLEDLSPTLLHAFLGANAEQRRTVADDLVSTLMDALRTFRARRSCTFVVHNFAQPTAPLLGLAEPMTVDSRSAEVRRINDALAAAARTLSDVVILDFDRVCATVGYGRWRDDRGWYLGRAPLSGTVSPPLAREHARVFRALRGTPRKCLVLDLDNTLWGGIVGEDGVAGVQVGEGYPGNVFLDFQRVLLQLHARGVLLALNTKNNESDVMELFRSRSEMLLRPEHFAAMRINWTDKPANMRAIAEELNIGTSALVFFDDNPAERARMRQAMPEVLTLEVPADPMGYVAVLEDARPFDRLVVTQEDLRRGSMQQEEQARRREHASAGSLQDFLHGLEMRVSIRPVDAGDAPRVVDLLRKTNQFNVTTRRHSAAQLDAMLQDRHVGAFSLRASDRFGDHGLVGVAIARMEGESAVIDSFLLSCRVIGRGVESALLVYVAEWARGQGARTLVGDFLPTPKNAPASDFFSRHGFAPRGAVEGAGTRWALDLGAAFPMWPAHVTRDDAGRPAASSLSANEAQSHEMDGAMAVAEAQ